MMMSNRSSLGRGYHGGSRKQGFPAASMRIPSSDNSFTERLWEEYFKDPSQWRDNRKTKTNPKAPDFKHKTKKQSLWVDSWLNPTWVREMLDERKLEEKGRKGGNTFVDGEACSDPAFLENSDENDKHLKPISRSGMYMDASKSHHVNDNTTSNPASRMDHKWIRSGHGDASTPHPMQASSGWESLSIEEALASLESMAKPPLVESFISLVQRCRKRKSIGLAKGVYMHIQDCRLEANQELGNYLVPMFVECGSMVDAQIVFDRLSHKNVYSWTSLIQGYTECGEPQHALCLFQNMREASVRPSMYTFVALLKACAKQKCLTEGRKLHDEIIKEDFETDPFVGTTLVDMYTKCGSLLDAQEVFDRLPIRNVVSWNAIITGYAEHGHGEDALNCLKQMRLEGMSPDAVTYVCSLKACGSMGALERGREIHGEVVRDGLETDDFLATAVVDMYAKCGALAESQEVFGKLLVRDAVSWNALIAGYVDHGLGAEALSCLDQMQLEGLSPNAVTFVCSLKACSSIELLDCGQALHAHVVKEGLERSVFVGNTLVDMYAKCGCLAEAHEVLDELRDRDVVSWTALISGYTEHRLSEEALDCLECMRDDAISPNAATFICALKACASIGSIDRCQAVHSDIVKQGFERDTFVGITLLDMYAKCGLLAGAQEVFDKLPVQSTVSWNALIAGYAEHRPGEALNSLEQMELQGVSLDAVTYVCTLKACGSTGATGRGLEVHAEIAKEGFETDPSVGTTLVNMYADFGLLAEAQEVFDRVPIRDVISWNALIAGYAEQGLGEEALKCLSRMQGEGVSPNAVTFLCSLKACSSAGAIDRGRELHADIAKEGFDTDPSYCSSFGDLYGKTGYQIHSQKISVLEATDVVIGNALMDMYGKCGSMGDAQEVFDTMPTRDIVSWNTLITGYGRQGKSESVLELFDRMREGEMQPDGITFLSVLNVCSHAGLVYKGQMYFEVMIKEYGNTLTIEHYNCMVDLLGRAGQLKEAAEMLENLPLSPNLVTWSTMLGACHKWGNVDLGRQAFDCVMKLDKTHGRAFILMSNIYADAQMWEDAKKIDEMKMKL